MLETADINAITPTSARVTELKTVDLVEGTGAVVEPNANITVNYIGAQISNGQVFESSYTSKPATFSLNGVIVGWTKGIPGMKVGGKRRLIIPANQAYGDSGRVSGDLLFDVELISIN